MGTKKHRISRRHLLSGAAAGAASFALPGGSAPRLYAENTGPPPVHQTGKGKRLFRPRTDPSTVSLVKGNDRRDIVYQALKKIEDQVVASIGTKRILIKPNFVSTDRQLAATHVDTVRAILDFLKPHIKQPVLIGESTASRKGTFDGFKNFKYLSLEREYNVKLLDLNREPWLYRYVIGKGHRPTPIRIISRLMDPDLYIISAAKMKTHDRVVTTLSLKNVLLAAPLNDYQKNDKGLTHSDFRFSRESLLHFNMFHLAREVSPDLGVIDGFDAMEGNGPVGGTPVDARVALASLDPLALDVLTTKLMGFDPTQIMYLMSFADAGLGQGDLDKIDVVGTPADQCQYHFKASRHMIEAYGLG